MITFTAIGNLGRLGNSLFQYAAAKSLSISNNSDLYLPADIYERIWHGQKCLLKNFSLNFKTIEENTNVPTTTFHEPYQYSRRFMPFFFEQSNVNLFGHFECEKYFEKYKDVIMKEFSISSCLEEYANNFINNIKQGNNLKVIGLHIRRGDDVEVHNIRFLSDAGESSWLYNYITKALSFFDGDKTIIIFTGGSRDTQDNTNDALWCEENIKPKLLKYGNIIISQTDDPMKDYALIKNCDGIIISNISTFAWWASYTNNNNALTIVPKQVPNGPNLDEYWAEKFIKI